MDRPIWSLLQHLLIEDLDASTQQLEIVRDRLTQGTGAAVLSVVVLCYRSGRSMIPLIERLLCSFALQLHVGTRAGR